MLIQINTHILSFLSSPIIGPVVSYSIKLSDGNFICLFTDDTKFEILNSP